MSKINTDYKKLINASEKLEALIYDANGLTSVSKNIKETMDTLSKAWKDKNHYEHLNAINERYEDLIDYGRTLEKYRKLLYDAGTEYKRVTDESKDIVKGI